MKTWSLMYAIIWLAFIDILVGFFSPFGYPFDLPIHALVGVLILGFAFQVQRRVRSTQCPDRIKRITRTTWYLGIFQALLGAALAAATALSLGGALITLIVFLHTANALAIVTQASSSSTAFDMWEEKEFGLPPTTQPS